MCLASIWCISSWVHFTVVDMTSFDPRVSCQTTKRNKQNSDGIEGTNCEINGQSFLHVTMCDVIAVKMSYRWFTVSTKANKPYLSDPDKEES